MPRILNKKNISVIILVIITLYLSGFFLNLFKLFKYDYDRRMNLVYEICGKESYGFINQIHKENNFNKNVKILNPNPNFSFNNSNWFKHKINKKFYSDRLILINENDNLEKISRDKYILTFNKKNLGLFKIVRKNRNCYYLKKYD